ncbi:MAG: protease modulator HflC [Immundisolibacterales bacterium]|nr:protease modulator HflC [Immundisolibacterales bacterium]
MSARIGIVILVVALIVASFSVFVVNERERAILFQLGKIVRDDYRPGLHFKMPFFQDVRKFDARIQTLDTAPELYLTKEKKNVNVDSYVKWRISDVQRFFIATGGSPRPGAARLHALNQTDLKEAFGRRTIPEVVAEDRAEIMTELTISLNEKAVGLGMEVIDVRIKRIDLEDAVSNSVYQRMAAERKEVAKDRRSRGEEEAKKIRAVAEREREVLLAEATREAERTRGEGDGTATEIYAGAYNADPEFYRFYRSLNAYTGAFRNKSDVILLHPGSEFWDVFNDPGGPGAARGGDR